jgi:hypothetical protein
MARSRLLKPGFFTNETLAELSFEARLCFAGLWTLADREGRLEDRPKRIGAALFPYDQVNVSDLLDALASKQFIRRYVADGQAVIDLPTFLEHQSPHLREAASELPKYQPLTEQPRKAEAFHEEAQPRSPCTVSVLVSDPVLVPVSEAAEKPRPVPASPDTHTASPKGATIFNGKDHLAHAACGRICVPAFLHRAFVAALGGPEDIANERLREWYARVMDALDPNSAIDPDAPKFWRPRFQTTFVKPGGVSAVYAPRGTCTHSPQCPDPWSHGQMLQAEETGDSDLVDNLRQLFAKRVAS